MAPFRARVDFSAFKSGLLVNFPASAWEEPTAIPADAYDQITFFLVRGRVCRGDGWHGCGGVGGRRRQSPVDVVAAVASAAVLVIDERDLMPAQDTHCRIMIVPIYLVLT